MKKKISVVVPMYNEKEVVDECYKKLTSILKSMKEYDYEIVCIDDGSNDSTLEKLEFYSKNDNNLKVLSFTRNFGHQAAVSAGLKYISGDAIIIIDADLQDPPELIKDMVKYWEERK